VFDAFRRIVDAVPDDPGWNNTLSAYDADTAFNT
jgi:hypothetical protein